MIDRRYRVVFGASLTQFTVIGILFSYGLLIKEFELEFGWSRTLLSSCTSLAFFGMGILALVGGRFSDKYGPRVVLSFTGITFGLGYCLISQVSAPWQLFLIFGTFVSIGMGTHDVVTLSTIAKWFVKRRGIMSALVKVGTACGQITIPPAAAYLIVLYGWRNTVIIMGLSASLLLVVGAFNMTNPPPKSTTNDTYNPTGKSLAEAKGERHFWYLCIIQFLFITTLLAIPVHIAVHGIDLGMSSTKASGLFSVIGGASIVGRLAAGFLFDKIGGKNSLSLCFIPLIVSLLSLVYVDTHLWLFIVVGIYGLAHGGLFTVVSPLIAEYFGMRAHGAIFGTILFFGAVGGAIGPFLVGIIFDSTGSYKYAFITLLIFSILSLLIALTLPPSQKPLSQ
jgi:MFS family permease